MIRTLIGLGVAGWVGDSLMQVTERHRLHDDPFAAFTRNLPSMPRIAGSSDRHVIASSRIVGARCHVQGQANGVAFTFSVDTGDPVAADFSSSHAKKLGLDPAALHYEEIWPGTRYGKIATTTLREIRVGDVVWNNAQVRIYSNWRFSFGDDETPLLGLEALQSRGIHVEFDGDMCRLTAPLLVEAWK
jgi:predicted aspartyl protease